MTISKVIKNGQPRYRVAYRTDGKEVRRFFKTKLAAEAFGRQLESERTTHGDAWLTIPQSDRAEILTALARARAGGYRLTEACAALEERHHVGQPRTLGEAASAFLEAKRHQGLRPRSLASLGQTVAAFVRGRESELVGSVTPDAIAQHIQRDDWSARRRHGVLIDLGTFFGWLVRMEWLTRSPVAKVPKPILEPTAPSVLTPEETERLLRAAEASDPELIGYLALCLFAGLRPESELGRLTPQDIGPEHVTVTTGAKTRRRRLVRISGNLSAFLGRWSALSGKLVPVNFARRIRKVRKLAGLESWPQDVMRHSFVSYHYALHGEADTVAQAGHSAEMLHEHYRGLVTAAQAAAYFAIMPRSEPYSQRQTDRAPMTTERARRLAGMRWSRS